MSALQFEVFERDYDSLPQFGKEHPVARAAAAVGGEFPFRLFSLREAGHVSGSPFLNSGEAVSAVAAQNPRLSPPPPGARFVLAGQQPGLLTGPLYTFLKAVTAIAVAEKLSTESDEPVLPLFWIASEDHDVLEVNHVSLFGKRFVHPFPGEIRRGLVPQVGDISLKDAREPLLAFLEETLPKTEFTPWVLDMVASVDDSDYATAFSGLLQSIFAEWALRVVDPRSLRLLTSPVLAALAAQWPAVEGAMTLGGKALRSAGFAPPLDSVGIFEIVDGKRVALEFHRTGARFSGGECSFAALAEEIRRRPDDFSPNAALRPILQDGVLPVIATVCGPTELVYLWQIGPIYEIAGISPSLPFPRLSATFVEARIRRAAEKAGLGMDRILAVQGELENYDPAMVAEINDPEIDTVETMGRALLTEVEKISVVRDAGWIQKSRKSLAWQIDKIVGRLREENQAKAGLGKKRLKKILDALYPHGKPQERVVNGLQFLTLYGPDFTRRILETLDPFRAQHHIVAVTAAKEA